MSYFLENKDGQLVRTLSWIGPDLYVIQRHDTGRVETTDNLEQLELENIEFTLIKSFQKSHFTEEFFKVDGQHSLRLVKKESQFQPSQNLQEDDEEKFIYILKRVAVASIAFMCLLTGINLLISALHKEEPLHVVEIMERPVPEVKKILPAQKQQIVKVQKKVKQIVVASKNKIVPHFAKRINLRKVANPTKKSISINQMGALAAFGNNDNSKQRGGINLDQVKTSAGIGQGGSAGSGGMQTSIYSKGLVSAPLGEGQRADGGGGYGTRGKGGGKAGYGKISLVGSSGSFFQPVESEAMIEGGLDRNEIAAVIQRHLSEVRYCYEQGLQQKPTLNGRVSMKFFIGPEGIVNTASVSSSSLSAPQVENCIREKLKTWNFPLPRGGVTVKVSYPFVLRRVTDS